MNAPNPPGNPQQPDPRGSRWLGFGLFWLVIVGGNLAIGILVAVLGGLAGRIGADRFGFGFGLVSFGGLLPWIGALVLAIWLANKGKTRTAQGIAFGFLSLFGVGLLLVAACFGILFLGGAGNWH
jgi:hypothetical protein